ncbi:MAG TPA: hypothetical protein VN736_15955 [Candidatus Limnocylindrales bacterium]|nr:hypothetical protein [Candidatus Limnocylindrales bacterium]
MAANEIRVVGTRSDGKIGGIGRPGHVNVMIAVYRDGAHRIIPAAAEVGCKAQNRNPCRRFRHTTVEKGNKRKRKNSLNPESKHVDHEQLSNSGTVPTGVFLSGCAERDR